MVDWVTIAARLGYASPAAMLDHLYWKNDLSIAKLAQRFGVGQGTMRTAFDLFGVPKRPPGQHVPRDLGARVPQRGPGLRLPPAFAELAALAAPPASPEASPSVPSAAPSAVPDEPPPAGPLEALLAPVVPTAEQAAAAAAAAASHELRLLLAHAEALIEDQMMDEVRANAREAQRQQRERFAGLDEAQVRRRIAAGSMTAEDVRLWFAAREARLRRLPLKLWASVGGGETVGHAGPRGSKQ